MRGAGFLQLHTLPYPSSLLQKAFLLRLTSSEPHSHSSSENSIKVQLATRRATYVNMVVSSSRYAPFKLLFHKVVKRANQFCHEKEANSIQMKWHLKLDRLRILTFVSKFLGQWGQPR